MNWGKQEWGGKMLCDVVGSPGHRAQGSYELAVGEVLRKKARVERRRCGHTRSGRRGKTRLKGATREAGPRRQPSQTKVEIFGGKEKCAFDAGDGLSSRQAVYPNKRRVPETDPVQQLGTQWAGRGKQSLTHLCV